MNKGKKEITEREAIKRWRRGEKVGWHWKVTTSPSGTAITSTEKFFKS